MYQQHDLKAKETPEHAARWKNLTASVKRLYDAGVPVAVGTDAGMPGTYHGRATLNEIELFVCGGADACAGFDGGDIGECESAGY